MDMFDSSVLERFWKYVNKTDTCWLWSGGRGNHGYGVLGIQQQKIALAHRLSYMIHCGPIPHGLLVCHHCDVRHCVRPEHLFLGTYADNMNDMLKKKGHWMLSKPESIARGARNGARTHPESVPRGARQYCAKLTEDQVREARLVYEKAQGRRGIILALAQQFVVARSTMGAIVHRHTWKHV